MRAYTELLVKTCHVRGAHAIGGMAAFIPSRRDPQVNEIALAKVTEDKRREAGDGFDGTWVAHPDLVPVALPQFEREHQLDRLREDVAVTEQELLDFDVPGSGVTDEGLRTNVSVGVRYLDAWLGATGAAAIDNSRAQVWSWVRNGRFDEARVREEIERVEAGEEAKDVFAEVALGDELVEFTTLVAYPRLP
jgi:malate synthase